MEPAVPHTATPFAATLLALQPVVRHPDTVGTRQLIAERDVRVELVCQVLQAVPRVARRAVPQVARRVAPLQLLPLRW